MNEKFTGRMEDVQGREVGRDGHMLKEMRREFGSAIKVRSRHRKCSDIVMNMSKDVGRDVMRDKNIERWRKPIFESERRKR